MKPRKKRFPLTDLHFVHSMISGDLVGGDDKVLLLDG